MGSTLLVTGCADLDGDGRSAVHPVAFRPGFVLGMSVAYAQALMAGAMSVELATRPRGTPLQRLVAGGLFVVSIVQILLTIPSFPALVRRRALAPSAARSLLRRAGPAMLVAILTVGSVVASFMDHHLLD